MKQKIVYWAPRVLSILFVLLLSVFSLDVFDQVSGWAVVPALLMHLMIPLILLIAVIVAWRYDIFGAAAFLLFIAYYFYIAGFDRHWSVYAVVIAPAAVICVLYLLSWRQLHRRN